MANQGWLPSLWKHASDDDEPFMALRKQIDNMFDDFDKGFFDRGASFRIRSNVSETDGDICVTAELPGLTDKDVDVSVTGEQITIKGEKKSEKEEKGEDEGREFHRVERMSGAFQRSMRLPFEIDAEKVSANVEDGILTVTIPKPPEVVERTKKVEVTHAKKV